MRLRRRQFAPSCASILCVVAISGAAGCKSRAPPHSAVEASPEGRKIIGAAPGYEAEAVDEAELAGSMRARRDAAWRIVARTLRAVSLVEADTLTETTAPRELRLWQTWYQTDEFNVLFRTLYQDLGKTGRRSKQAFGRERIDSRLAWLAERDFSEFAWTAERFQRRLGNVKTAEDVNGIPGTDGMAGRGMTFFSPAVIRHLLDNYSQILDCGPKLAALPPQRSFGEGQPFTPCFTTEFPRDSVAIKTAWIAGKSPMPRFDTDAAMLTQQLQSGTWQPNSSNPVPLPSPEQIYTMRARPTVGDVGPTFRLGGMHIVTKEARHWLWISLWWSPAPDEDFGADRPAEIAELGTAWTNYKMCVVSAFDEGDPTPWSSYQTSHPTLAAALKATHQQGGDSTWCSNPYIEKGVGNSRTNCIGCHQHAGSRIVSDDVFADEARYPNGGRHRQRENFPGDYLWAFDNGNDVFEPTIVAETARQDELDGSP